MKGNQLILLVLLVLIIGGVGTYLYISDNNREDPAAALALPESSVFAYQGMNIEKGFAAIKQLDWYKFIRPDPSVAAFEKDFLFFDSLANTGSFKKSLAGSPMVVSLHVTASDNYQLLFLHQSRNSIKGYDIERLVKEKDPDARALEHTFEGQRIFEMISGGKQSLFSFTILEGIVAVSRNPGLVEESVHAYRNHSRAGDLVQKMAASVSEEKIFINFSRLPDFLNVYASAETGDIIKSLGTLGSFGDYTIRYANGEIRLNGSVHTGSSKSLLWNAMLNQKPGSTHIPDLLPTGTAMFSIWCADSFAGYFAGYKNYLKATKESDAWEDKKRACELETGLKTDKDIVPLFGADWGYAIMEPAGDNSNSDELLVASIRDSIPFEKFVNKVTGAGDAPAAEGSKGEKSWRGFKISHLVLGKTLNLLFGDLFSRIENPYMSEIGDYAVFSNSAITLEKCIDAYLDKQALSNAALYKSFSHNMMGASNFYFYLNPSRASGIAEKYIRNSYESRFSENLPFYRGFECFGFQLSSNGTEFNSEVLLSRTIQKDGISELAWSISLEADLLGKPHIVDDAEKGHKGIIIQDKNNTIYLLSTSGAVSWKRKLDEPITGDIYTMDLYKNGLSEFLFATTNKLYLIDQNGKDAGSYPLNLAETTHTGLSLFDMNKDKDYTYMVCCDRGKIYGYSGSGKPIPGWTPMLADGRMPYPLQAFSSEGKNYFCGLTAKGTLYLWNNKGQKAMNPVALHANCTEPMIVSPETKTFFAADTSGVVYSIGFDGAVKKNTYSRFTSKPFFGYIPKNEKGIPEYVLSSRNIIAGYSGTSMEDWKLITGEKINNPPQIINFNGKVYIAYLSDSVGRINLFTPSGISFPGFPRPGNTVFTTGDLNNSGDLDLLMGGTNKVMYHYRLH